MRARFLGLVSLAIAFLAPAAVWAGTPRVSIYFDRGYTVQTKDCPGYVVDYLYIVAEDFNIQMAGIEFAVDYPEEILWLSDMEIPPVTLGQTPTGISMGFGLPVNAYSPVLLTKVAIYWNCDHCTRYNVPICPTANPYSGYVRATRFPDYALVYGMIEGAWICPTMCLSTPGCVTQSTGCPQPPAPPVPVEDLSWGKIKELYR